MKNYFKNKKILIAGGSGLVGTNLLIKLIGLKAKVEASYNTKIQAKEHCKLYKKYNFLNKNDCNRATKNKDVVEKMKKSSIQYYQSDTYLDKRKEQVKQTLCKCGCNTIIDYYGENIPKFVNRKHYNNYQKSENAPKVTEETRNKQSKKAKENILKLTDEQRKERLKKSCLSCDQEKRGNSI